MGITHPKFKGAVVQAAPVWLDLEGTVAKTITYIEEAASEGAKLITFPETWIPGYPWHIWVGTPAWTIARGFVHPSANELRHARLQAFRNTNAMAVHARPVISTIIRRESHWQSRLLRNDRH